MKTRKALTLTLVLSLALLGANESVRRWTKLREAMICCLFGAISSRSRHATP